MSLPVIATSVLILFLGVIVKIFFHETKKSKKLNVRVNALQKNQEYFINLLKDIQDISGYGNDLGNVIEVIAKSLENKLPFSTISSVYIKSPKIIFKSQVQETVNHAFIMHIKDTLVQDLIDSNLTSTDSGAAKSASAVFDPDEIEETIIGGELDDMASSQIKSSLDLKLTINGRNQAIINLSSTTSSIYSEDDKKILAAVSMLVSDFLTRIDVLLKLEKSKSLAMIDSFSDGIFMIGRSESLLAMNDAALKFLNINKIPVMGDILSALPNTYNFRDKIDRVIERNERIEENDVSINNKFFKIIITPVLENNTPGKNILGASVLLKDITLEKSLAQLKEDFTNVMVHELRSPLTAIRASSEFLMSQADLTGEEKKRLVEMIAESSKKMLDKISLILDSAKLDSGLFTLRKTEGDIKKLINDRIKVFTPLAQEKSINLKVEIDPNIPIFPFDPIRIDEVINNLLSNSLKFTPENGTISVYVTLSTDKVLVSVTDTGSGIPKDKQHLLFAKYQQAPTDSEHVGTGLGLYVVKELIEDHGGTVSLVSDEGKGTTISFTIPLHATSQTLQSSQSPKKPSNPLAN